jgi:hypothetical protein
MSNEFESITRQIEKEIANDLTEFRSAKGRPAIRLSQALSSSARYMAARDAAGQGVHCRMDNRPPLERAQIVGNFLGEEVLEFFATGAVNSSELSSRITSDPKFQEAIQRDDINETGVGIAGNGINLFCRVQLGARKSAPIPNEPQQRDFPDQMPADVELWGDALWKLPRDA